MSAPAPTPAYTPDLLGVVEADAVIGQLEVPAETLLKAAAGARKLFAVNLAPPARRARRATETRRPADRQRNEAAFYGDALNLCDGLVATTYGKDGAVLRKRGVEIAKAAPPKVDAIDTVGAGDTFVGA